jgi:hypothetical protein
MADPLLSDNYIKKRILVSLLRAVINEDFGAAFYIDVADVLHSLSDRESAMDALSKARLIIIESGETEWDQYISNLTSIIETDDRDNAPPMGSGARNR